MRKIEEYWTWNGDKNAEGALRCLMGLNPMRGLDWFPLTEDRYRIINELSQEYLDVLAARVLALRVCSRCGRRFRLHGLFDKDCPHCGFQCSYSPIRGQAPGFAEESLRKRHNVDSYCTPRRDPVYVADILQDWWRPQMKEDTSSVTG